MAIKALFLDRDGVININHGYVHRVEDFEFINDIFEITSYAQNKSYKIFVITNQAGIGRGYYDVAAFNTLTTWMCKQFKNKNIEIVKVYFSPYHPTAGIGKYKKNHHTRKPNPGMILKAQTEFSIDLDNSILIGDKMSDIHAGIFAGVATNILFDKCKKEKNNNFHVISNLKDAKKYIK
mgnify:CR=1 FL=1